MEYRHEPRKRKFEPARGHLESIEKIEAHIEKHVGKIKSVYHELVSDLVHIDVHHVEPTADRPYHTLVTSGMSDKPMETPEEFAGFRFAELMMCLPSSWPVSDEAFKDPANYWPAQWLKILARFPHEFKTWLGWGHTIPNGEPPRPLAANTNLCCFLLLQPALFPKEFGTLKLPDRTLHFYSVVPIYAEEMEFKLQEGTDSLLDRFEENQITELLGVIRKNVVKGK